MNFLPQIFKTYDPSSLDLSVLDRVLSWPTWRFVQEMIVATRRYEEGLEAGVVMFSFLEDHREKLPEQTYSDYAKKLLWFVLDMMDRSDQWEEYLQTWESIRKTTCFHLVYAARALKYHGGRMTPFLLDIPENQDEPTLVEVRLDQAEGVQLWEPELTRDLLRVHFLWPTLRRKEMIAKKVRKARAGEMVGNLYHRPLSDLTPAEVERRIQWITRLAGEHPAQTKS